MPELKMNEAYICEAVRTPIGRYAGSLSTVRPDDLGAHVIRNLLLNSNLPPEAIQEVILGCANQSGEDNRNVARMSALLAGLPTGVPGTTVNRLCASGLDAVGFASRSIKSGELDVVVAGGVESMTRAPFVMGKAETAFSRTAAIEDTTIGWRFINKRMKELYGVDSMPETAENVAEQFEVSREDQDKFALTSQQRTKKALENDVFAEEIAPYSIFDRKGNETIISIDEHPRLSELDVLAKLRAIVKPGGSVTAGNASGVNDGACAMIIASAAAVKQHGLVPRARILGIASAGVEPRIMGMGPVEAVNRLNARLNIKTSDYDVIELNEAFASQALACLRQLGVPDDAEHVNPNGGAIALGHPLGMSGARIVMTLTRELKARGKKLGLATMCVGVGQGVAMAIETLN
jgi:3-oxoadipyl-CoA thiolase